MARKKNAEDVPEILQGTMVEAQSEEASSPIDEGAGKHPAEEAQSEETVFSEQTKKLLRCYPNYAALYVDSKGGVYPEDAQPNLVGDAILYQNPYYKA